jgi:hypothetical protein
VKVSVVKGTLLKPFPDCHVHRTSSASFLFPCAPRGDLGDYPSYFN